MAAIAAVYLITNLLTELLTNNAAAALVFPIAIATAHKLGIDPRPLVIAVTIAASAAYATPIGYQTNTLVYSVGGYKFTDYLRLGTPLNIITGAIAIFLIPVFWPF